MGIAPVPILRWDDCMSGLARLARRLAASGAIALVLAASDRQVSAQGGEFHPDLPHYAGVWRGIGGGWQATIEITRTPITPSRSLLRIALACRDEAGALGAEQRSFGHVVDARQIDLLIRFGGERGPLLRIYGTVPDLALSTVAGRPACARRAALPLEREP